VVSITEGLTPVNACITLAFMDRTADRPPDRKELLAAALERLESLTLGRGTTEWIGALESRLPGSNGPTVRSLVERDGIGAETLEAAVQVKRMAGQINVLVHAIEILNALPYILEPGEIVESVSLGAGNTGRAHDLETNRRVAEFKFIEWRGGPESIRQNGVFADLFNLASSPTQKRRVLYVVGAAIPLRFLENRRALSSVMSRDAGLAARFRAAHGDRFLTVRDYYETIRDRVEIVDLVGLVPGLTAG
jgi:hypothetical protein